MSPRYTTAWKVGNTIYVAGQTASDGEAVVGPGDIRVQTRTAFERIRTILEEAGASMEDVVKTTVWLKRAEDFAEFNAAYAPFFPKDPPARSTAESRLMIDILVEIEAVAYKPL